MKNVPPGAVAGFFPYNDTEGGKDEIDFELLGTLWPNALWLNTWNNGEYLRNDLPRTPVSELKDKDWNKYTIRWASNGVDWNVNGRRVRSEGPSSPIPDASLQIHFNHWAPSYKEFDKAYASSLQPTDTGQAKQIYYYDVRKVKASLSTTRVEGKTIRPRRR